MKQTKKFIYVFILFFCTPDYAGADDPIELPPIKVVAPATDGTNILCQGSGCWLVLLATEGAYAGFDNYLDMATLLEPALIDRKLFCSNLKGKQPRKCRLGSIPSTPVYDPGWQPNGCGTGAIANAAVSSLMSSMFDGFYSLDEPYQGVSFAAACDAHDRCFASAGGFYRCNDAFSIAMADACNGGTIAGSSAASVCSNYAAAYRAAVSTDEFGRDAYTAASKLLTCAAWHQAMKMNRCF